MYKRHINTLKQELDGTRAYQETDSDEMSVVNDHLNKLPLLFLSVSMKTKQTSYDVSVT